LAVGLDRCLPLALGAFARAAVRHLRTRLGDRFLEALIRFAENARLLGEVLVDALGRERGFFINPHSIVPVSNRAALPNVGSDELFTAVCRRLLDTCWTPKEFNQPSL
jgi:hypothetical protein